MPVAPLKGINGIRNRFTRFINTLRSISVIDGISIRRLTALWATNYRIPFCDEFMSIGTPNRHTVMAFKREVLVFFDFSITFFIAILIFRHSLALCLRTGCCRQWCTHAFRLSPCWPLCLAITYYTVCQAHLTGRRACPPSRTPRPHPRTRYSMHRAVV